MILIMYIEYNIVFILYWNFKVQDKNLNYYEIYLKEIDLYSGIFSSLYLSLYTLNLLNDIIKVALISKDATSILFKIFWK